MIENKFNHEAMFKEMIREELERAGQRSNSSRVTFQEEERKYWVGWLPDDLGRRADQIKKFVEVLYEDNEKHPPLRHYTPHGISHCQAVEDNLHRLIPNELHKNLTEKEKFFLIISAWIHDIGMLRIFNEDMERDDDDYIRDFHHERSERYLANHYKLIGINEEEAATLGLLARFHRRRCDIDDCPYYLTISNKDTIRLRLMAAYLRLADALHIDQSRTPDDQYAISLAYNIPYKSKLHWYRSKFVHGIRVDEKEKAITVQVKCPREQSDDDKNLNIQEKYDIIYNIILDDLNEEIESVKNVLFTEGITYFLSAEKEVVSVEVDDIFKKDVDPVLHYYHLLDNPSSSALINLVLDAVQGIALSGKQKICDENEGKNKNIREKIKQFLNEIEKNVLSSRKCHAALSNLIERIKKNIVENNNNEVNKKCDIIALIENEKCELKRNKSRVRYYSAKYLTSNYEENLEKVIKDHFNKKINEILSCEDCSQKYSNSVDVDKDSDDRMQRKINIILYGYSELSIETLCGFRDAVSAAAASECRKQKSEIIKNTDAVSDIDISLYKRETISKFEEEASSCFRVFCCEGQPKNHTTWSGRYHHHDGSMYAIELAKRGFKDINIIPDAAAASIISMSAKNEKFPNVDFIIIGTNGFDKDNFMHSSGHSMIVSASLLRKEENKKINVVLALMTDKFKDKNSNDNKKCECKEQKSTENGGWYFKNGFCGEQVRDHSFFTQDCELQKQLYKYKDIIKFYNPREDGVEISLVDVVISEKCFLVKDYEGDEKWNGEYIKSSTKNSINQREQSN